MNLRTLLNIARNASRPGFFPEMLRKLNTRISERSDKNELSQWVKSLSVQKTNPHLWAQSLDEPLWNESLAFAEAQNLYATNVLSSIPVKLGGGGFYSLLYFLTRYLKPETILETGVAAGFSSRAFLKALEGNGTGHLYSSDFPYFRLENPEKYVGILVEPELRQAWTLNTKGDKVALPDFAKHLHSIDLFHYDSDKSVAGRNFALDTVAERFSVNSVIIFDDIQDNLHFKTCSEKLGSTRLIFEFEGKYIGLLTNNAKLASGHIN